jgi:hypothetical protein
MTLPLDPRKSPWKRGDVVTLGFEKNGFVLNHTPEYLEVLWMGPDDTVERVPTEQVENLLRVAHADSLSPDGSKTNLEKLKARQALQQIRDLAEQREKSFKNERERRQADAFVRRSFATGGCAWDKTNSAELLRLALEPDNVGVIFKLRERLHRMICRGSH